MKFFMKKIVFYKESTFFLELGYRQFDTFLFIFTAETLN